MAIKQGLCDQFKADVFNGVHAPGNTYKAALYTSSAALDPTTTAYSATNEVSGAGYSAGGATLAGLSITLGTSTPVACSITRSGAVATVTLSNHGFYTGQWITIAGASQTDYNVSARITVVDANTFTYAVANAPATPATGSPVASYKAAVWTFTSPTWAAATITARGMLIYNNTAAGKNAIVVLDFVTDFVSTGGTFLVTLPAATPELGLIVFD